MQTDRPEVARILREIAQLLLLRSENRYRARAYDVAADKLLSLADEELADKVQKDQLTELEGIGPSLAAVIGEIVRTGGASLHQELVAEWGEGALHLLAVPELGPRKVSTLIKKQGIRSLADLESAAHLGTLPNSERILQNLEVVKRSRQNYPFGKVLPLAESLRLQLGQHPGVRQAQIAGALRRRTETVQDIHLIASVDETSLPKIWNLSGGQSLGLELGERSTRIPLREGTLEARLSVVRTGDFPLALNRATGSEAHQKLLEMRAAEMGLSLRSDGLFRGSEKLPLSDEAALYRAVGLPFIPPELREGILETQEELPHDLLRAEDVQGLVHSHSTYSDGKNSLEEMAKAAQALGLKYLTVTDHSQAAGYAGGLDSERLKRQCEEIDGLNARLSTLRLLKGIEADILQDGSLDLGDAVLSQLDVVIGSIHQRHQMDEAQMTERVLRALDCPHLHILGHPTGRLISRRPPYGLRMEEVLDRAAKRNVAVEVNGNPERQDIKSEYVRMAIKRGVKLTVSADSHSVDELVHLSYAVATARAGWAKKKDVLNTLPADDFVQALHAK